VNAAVECAQCDPNRTPTAAIRPLVGQARIVGIVPAMHKLRITTLTAAVATLAMAGVATAATSPVVSKERTFTGTKAPVAIGGMKKGAKLPSGDKIVLRTVAFSKKGQTATVALTAPKGKTFQALAHSGKMTIKLTSPKSIKGAKSAKVRATSTAKGTGTVYALAH
jgi:hypothetical protein